MKNLIKEEMEWEDEFDEIANDYQNNRLPVLKTKIKSFIFQEYTEKIVEGIGKEVEDKKKSLLADMAYQIDAPKTYIAFQRSKDLHYNSYNRAVKDIGSFLSSLIDK